MSACSPMAPLYIAKHPVEDIMSGVVSISVKGMLKQVSERNFETEDAL